MKRTFSCFAMAAGLSLLGPSSTWAADDAQQRAQLSKAISSSKVTMEQGLRSSESHGKPISAKFELENGKLQLSVYTAKAGGYSEVVIDPASGKTEKASAITDKEDLEHASAQKSATDKAKTTLLAATDKALKAHSGYRVVSVYSQLKDNHPVAEVTLLRGQEFQTVTERLD